VALPAEPSPAGLNRTAAIANLAGLGLLVLGVVSYHRTGFHSGDHVVALALLVVATAGWLGWAAARTWDLPPAAVPASLLAMAGGGGALTGFVGLGCVFAAVGALGATLSLPVRRAAAVVLVAAAAIYTSVPAAGAGVGVALSSTAALTAGTAMGLSRRSANERAAHAAAAEIAEARAEAEAARAELLAGRNHLARELHDVLAHTLSALSLQLEALGALLGAGPVDPAVTAQLEDIRRLVREGVDEARGAVAALREDLPPLAERLTRLGAERRAAVHVTGTPRELPAEVALALYRAAQEGLTNAVKHAPGTVATVELDYSDKEVSVAVTNPPPPDGAVAAAAGAGGGYGLQGIRERVLLVGGQVEAGPAAGGWRVEARVPA
jgi:signal transduction histidine kinase